MFVVHSSLFVGLSLYYCGTYVHLTYFEIGFDWLCFLGRGGVEYWCKSLWHNRLWWFCRLGNWVCFAKNRAICRGVSTSVEGGSWPRRHKGTRRQTDRGFGSAEIKMQSAKLRNPDLVGMGVLVVASFSISRILYLLDVYYTWLAVGCQVKFNHRFHRFSQINLDLGGGQRKDSKEFPAEITENAERRRVERINHKFTRIGTKSW